MDLCITSDLELIIATFESPCTWDLPVMDDCMGRIELHQGYQWLHVYNSNSEMSESQYVV